VSHVLPISSSVIRERRFSLSGCNAAATLHWRSPASWCQS
jgi:hypothetical protein